MSTPTAADQAPTQLALLDDPSLALQFRLDRRTRERGLAHIAAIKAQLAARAELRADTHGLGNRRAA
jgi:hypothetical protein